MNMDRIEIYKKERDGKKRYEAIVACYDDKNNPNQRTGHLAEASGSTLFELFYHMGEERFFDKLENERFTK